MDMYLWPLVKTKNVQNKEITTVLCCRRLPSLSPIKLVSSRGVCLATPPVGWASHLICRGTKTTDDFHAKFGPTKSDGSLSFSF